MMFVRYLFLAPILAVTLFWFLVNSLPAVAQQQQAEEYSNSEIIDVFSMSVKDLLDITIITATNTQEKMSDAPAVVLVLTQQQLQRRGYSDLIELFDDLPGIDTSITYGDLYFRPYWRGLRKGVSSSFLFMIDGMVMNHLFYNWTDIMAAVPLSFIKQVEVVYGPASATYGANAMMGVVNVITEKGTKGKTAKHYQLKIAKGSNESRIFDMSYLYREANWGVRLSALINQGDLDKDSLDNYVWTNPELLSERRLWGGFLDNSALAGAASSPRKMKSFSLAGFFHDTEIGYQLFRVETGYGLDYAFDKLQIQTPWIEQDSNLYLRNSTELNERVTSHSLMRYRESNILNNSSSVDGYPLADGSRLLSFSYWQALNSSWSAEQSFDIKVSENFDIKAGIKYEQKDLHKAFDVTTGPGVSPSDLDVSNYPFPEPPQDSYHANNRAIWEYEGIFIQAKYRLNHWFDVEQDHFLNFGVRSDDNSFYGRETTFRAGYVGQFDEITAKILYGEAIQEPTPRELYGGWAGSGSSADLSPELSKTFEVYLAYNKKNYSLALNPYFNQFKDSILNLVDGPQNIARSDVFGFDIHFHHQFEVSNNQSVRLWSYYSYIDPKEDQYDQAGIKTGTGRVGDMAKNKIHFGLTTELMDKRLTATIRGRYIDDKKTVITNPVKKVDSYFTLDSTLIYHDLFAEGLDLSFKINNLFDEQYFHPGVRDASAGNSEGYFDDNDHWQGSASWSNSLLPQPGRSFSLALQGNF